MMLAKWLKLLRKYHFFILIVIMFNVLFYYYGDDVVNEDYARRQIGKNLNESLIEEQGEKCEIPKLNPYVGSIWEDVTDMPKIICKGFDWVRCNLSDCYVKKEIFYHYENVVCQYQDILFVSDNESILSEPSWKSNKEVYVLMRSDHVKVECAARLKPDASRSLLSSWSGYVQGFRYGDGRLNTDSKWFKGNRINIAIIVFSSASKNGFIRRMPKSYKALTEDIEAVILNGYNVIGDGKSAALLPILTGWTALELPERRKTLSNRYLDDFPFIFYKLREVGYRTAYFEDRQDIGTFQHRFNGFLMQPTDHYLRHFYLRKLRDKRCWKNDHNFFKRYCVGDTPTYQLMLSATEQVISGLPKIDVYKESNECRKSKNGLSGSWQVEIRSLCLPNGKQFFKLRMLKFILTFMTDITRNNFKMISAADEYFADWLKRFKKDEHLEDTLLFVIGDHGTRFGPFRDTLAGKIEERLPLMAIRIPNMLLRAHPAILETLKENAEVITTPRDIHATMVDALALENYPEKKSARSLTLFQPIPDNRTCSEAGIEKHWCVCMKWTEVHKKDPMFSRVMWSLLDFINSLTEPYRNLCMVRNIKHVYYVQRHMPNEKLLKFSESKDPDGYLPRFNGNTEMGRIDYYIKMVTGPGIGIYEASMAYILSEDTFDINAELISRIDPYNDHPHCISKTQPDLEPFCYCKDILKSPSTVVNTK